MNPWWLLLIIPGTAFVVMMGMAALIAGGKADDVSEAYDEGYRKASEKVHDEYEKRRIMTDKLYRRVMRVYSGEIERARLEIRHLRVMAGIEQEGVE